MLPRPQIAHLCPLPAHFCPDFAHDNEPFGDEPDQSQQPASKIKRVMVVDDDILVAETLVEILRMEGYKAIPVSEGASAIKWAEFLEPDAIICDVAMPGLDGFAVAERIRAQSPGCRIILLSGHAGVLRRLANMPIDANDFEFLAKPVKPETILAMLRDLKKTE